MFFKILKRDIKRKKSMNIILLLFMILIGMFVSSSSNMLYTETMALDAFMDKSKSADFLVVYNKKDNTDEEVNKWATDSTAISDYSFDETISINPQNLILPENRNKYSSDSIMVLTAQSKKHNILFNDNDEILKINNGEIAIPRIICEDTGLVVGDKITVLVNGTSKELTLKCFVKDATFGSDMTGFKRIAISDNDYDFFNNAENITNIEILSCIANDLGDCDDISKSFDKISVNNVIVAFTSKMIKLTYMPDLLMAGIMVLVSIFLTLIAFLVLRFTIVFTLQEEYKEIGIMKAIGIKNKKIGNIYLVKYLFISVIGSAIGFALSLPFSNQMLKLISKNIVIAKSNFALLISVLSVIFVVLITLFFCKLCTRKINKFSAIDAIRNGTTGERFSKSKKINLHKCKHIKVAIFMAISDLINGWKRFLILIITFVFGTILILVPINLINTIDSGGMLQYMGLDNSDVFIDFGEFTDKLISDNTDEMFKNLEVIEKKYADKGVDLDLHFEAYFQLKIYADDKNESQNIASSKGYNYSTDNYVYSEGTAPKLENEIALTENVADYLAVGIGDTVHCKVGEKTYDFIVTALFQSMVNLGKSARFSEDFDMDITGYSFLFVPGKFNASTDITSSIQKLKEITPDYIIKTNTEFISSMMGNVTEQVNPIRNVIIALVLGINFLITVLVIKMLVSKEISEIAIMKSMGFKNRTIKLWQTFRISVVLIVSVIIGTIVANKFGHILISAVFKSFGISRIKQNIIPVQVYLLYPLLIIIATLLAISVSLGQIKKIKVWEINNQE